MNFARRCVVFVLLSFFSLSAIAQPQLYGVNSGSGGQFLATIDHTDGTLTNVGNTSMTIDAIAWADGVLYAADNGGDRLVTLDPTTGALDTVIGSFGGGYHLESMDYRHSDGTLFAVQHSTNELVEVNTSTGAVTVVGLIHANAGSIAGLAFTQDETLYAISYSDGSVWTINPDTGAGTLVGTGGVGPLGLAAHPDTDVLYVANYVSGSDDQLQELDRTNGSRALVGVMAGGQQIEGLTFSGERVEPPTPDNTSVTFQVTKVFAAGGDGEVEVNLTCNSGIPLQQSFTIAGGDPDGVTFTVTEIIEGQTTCEVTETLPDGTAVVEYYNGTDYSDTSCLYEAVAAGAHTCEITNFTGAASFLINLDWQTDSEGDVNSLVEVDFFCENLMFTPGGELVDESGTFYLSSEFPQAVGTSYPHGEEPYTRCRFDASAMSSHVAVENGCFDWIYLMPGEGDTSCTILATYYIEGIPTLSSAGKILMILMVLGVGFVGFRRFG